MITRKLKIINIDNKSFIENKCINYSYAFHKLYKQIEMSNDKQFIINFKERFNLNDIEYRSLLFEVNNLINRNNIIKKNKILLIEQLSKNLDNEKNKHKKYKLFNRISFLKKSLNNDMVFGGRTLLQKISRECNKTNKDETTLIEWKKEYKSKRILAINILGEANRNGNRFFDFKKIRQGIIIYRPYKNIKITINFKFSKSLNNEIIQLSDLSDKHNIPITIKLNTDYIYIIFDEEKLNGYSIDEKSRRKEVDVIKSLNLDKEEEQIEIKKIYKYYYDKQHEVKLQNKIKDRCFAIDMNPTEIGWSVLDKVNDVGEYKIVKCGVFDLSKLCLKTGKTSSDKSNIHLANKRKYEITIVIKRMFEIIKHYKCSSFIVEDLNIDINNNLNREANRKIKNLWNRNLILSIINRRCNQTGVELIKVNACYSSFIGNIQHKFNDSCNSSIEIGRRGLFKYNKGMFYPHITNEDLCTMKAKFGVDVMNGTICNWVNMYKSVVQHFKGVELAQRLRAALSEVKIPYSMFSIYSYKSKITLINYVSICI